MARSRLTLALESGDFALPESGRIAVLRPPGGHDLSALPRERVHVVQGFFPDHQAWAERGLAVSVAPEGEYAAALVCLPRAKAHARALVAQARALAGEGPVLVDGQKTDGVESILRDCRRAGARVEGVLSKAHGKLFWFAGGDFADWQTPAESRTAEGFVTSPGVFSADGVDRGSRLLAEALPAGLSGRVADLGAGWGYLARAVLAHDGVSECHLVEAEHDALECARLNVTDPRARFHWADARSFADEAGFDHVVTNPPFHTGREADTALGQAFVAAAARLLRPRGTLWLVANRHLPYEASLQAAFVEVAEVGGDSGFKLFRAARPRWNRKE